MRVLVSCSLISILGSSLDSSLVQCLDSLGVIDTVGSLYVIANRHHVSVFVLLLHTKYLNLLLLVCITISK